MPMIRRTRRFNLSVNEVVQIMEAFSSDSEAENELDEEDVNFIQEDIIAGQTASIIEGANCSGDANFDEENFEEDSSPIVWRKLPNSSRNVGDLEGSDYGEIKFLHDQHSKDI